MPSDDLFSAMFSTPAMREVVAGRAWVAAMLEAKAALARAEALVGLIPSEAAAAITAACKSLEVDTAELGRAALAAANPAGPLVDVLRASLPPDAADFVHHGATSQDIVDTAMMLVLRRGLVLIRADLLAAGDAAAGLAHSHRRTVMAGRTLLQHAVPITFGLKTAGWLATLDEAHARLGALRLPAQLGGAAGTLSALGPDGPRVAALFAAELGLAAPDLPWHTSRAPVAEAAAALAITAGSLAKVALDVTLLAQTEVGEVSEGSGGRSSTMPHKRNPAGAVRVSAAARRAQSLAPPLFASMVQEHERAAGGWQAEWPAIGDLLEATAAAASGLREVLEGLHVYPERMAANLDAAGPGVIMSEAVVAGLAPRIGMSLARSVVEGALARGTASGATFRDALLADAKFHDVFSPAELDRILDPAAYLGANDVFIDRALSRHDVMRASSVADRSRLPALRPEDLPEPYRGILEALAAERGFVPNLYGVVANSPPFLADFIAMVGTVREGGALPARPRELAILAVARETGADTIRVSHEQAADEAGIGSEERDAVATGVRHPGFGEADLATLVYAEEATRHVRVNDAAWRAVEAALTTEQAAELICVVAFYNMVARILEPARVPLDPRYSSGS